MLKINLHENRELAQLAGSYFYEMDPADAGFFFIEEI
tara:strand:+ start:595 stop:705 length:111 start_codon:yes stop_codon:yes gene_type:complete